MSVCVSSKVHFLSWHNRRPVCHRSGLVVLWCLSVGLLCCWAVACSVLDFVAPPQVLWGAPGSLGICTMTYSLFSANSLLSSDVAHFDKVVASDAPESPAVQASELVRWQPPYCVHCENIPGGFWRSKGHLQCEQDACPVLCSVFEGSFWSLKRQDFGCHFKWEFWPWSWFLRIITS